MLIHTIIYPCERSYIDRLWLWRRVTGKAQNPGAPNRTRILCGPITGHHFDHHHDRDQPPTFTTKRKRISI